MRISTIHAAVGALALAAVPPAVANVTIATVPVGNPGNLADPSTGFGEVAYDFAIGRFEVTAGQYAEFLNAVAATDSFALYSTTMFSNVQGCKIQRSGVAGSFTYSVAPEYADRPANYIKFGAALRFANWLHNGQPAGAQDASTTEDGSYLLNGATSAAALNAVVRSPGATWVLPSQDEWYKAAYHHNDGLSGNYFEYPTGSSDVPGRDLSEVTNPGNNANYTGTPFPIDSGLYYTTIGGEFELSLSPYGTYDQGGNVAEWTEGIASASNRVVRGGSFNAASTGMHAANPGSSGAANTTNLAILGFRVGLVPTPGASALLALGALAAARRRR